MTLEEFVRWFLFSDAQEAEMDGVVVVFVCLDCMDCFVCLDTFILNGSHTPLYISLQIKIFSSVTHTMTSNGRFEMYR